MACGRIGVYFLFGTRYNVRLYIDRAGAIERGQFCKTVSRYLVVIDQYERNDVLVGEFKPTTQGARS